MAGFVLCVLPCGLGALVCARVRPLPSFSYHPAESIKSATSQNIAKPRLGGCIGLIVANFALGSDFENSYIAIYLSPRNHQCCVSICVHEILTHFVHCIDFGE